MAVYADSSALTKLIRREPESEALADYIASRRVISSELCLTEVPRALRRHGAAAFARVLQRNLEAVIDDIELVPIEAPLLRAAGAFAEPTLRSLDAIHVAAALAVTPIEAFVTYDDRQAAAARLAGLRTAAPSPT